MPFDNELYDGIFCYALIHLLNKNERIKLITDCYNQLAENGFMVFTTITKDARTYGRGVCVDKDRFEMFGGVKMFFYDREAIKEEFDKVGLFEVSEINENYPFYLIKCKKASLQNSLCAVSKDLQAIHRHQAKNSAKLFKVIGP
jgi:hypothetical protein